MESFLASIFTGIFNAVFGPILAAINKHQANKQATEVSNEQQHLDEQVGKEQQALDANRAAADAATGRNSAGELRDDSDAVQSAIDRANGKLP